MNLDSCQRNSPLLVENWVFQLPVKTGYNQSEQDDVEHDDLYSRSRLPAVTQSQALGKMPNLCSDHMKWWHLAKCFIIGIKTEQ